MNDSVSSNNSATSKYLAVLVLLLCSFIVQADDSLLAPQKVIQEASDQLRSILSTEQGRNDLKQARGIVETVLEPHVDFKRFSALVLGKHWKRAQPDQRSQFTKEFKELLIRTYATAYSEFTEWKLRFLPLRIKPDEKRVVVKTQIQQSGKPPLAVSYRMVNRDGTWLVYDVITEGISLIKNYRTSFNNKIARTGSLDNFLEYLKSRNQAIKRGS